MRHERCKLGQTFSTEVRRSRGRWISLLAFSIQLFSILGCVMLLASENLMLLPSLAFPSTTAVKQRLIPTTPSSRTALLTQINPSKLPICVGLLSLIFPLPLGYIRKHQRASCFFVDYSCPRAKWYVKIVVRPSDCITYFRSLQPPKSIPVEQKRALVLGWIQRSGTAHNIKDLEKALPSVASCHAMQVKELIQNLTDDNLVRVEKIGSGNWYWSFPSEVQLRKEEAVAKAQEENAKATAMAEELQGKVDEASAAREDDDDDRPALMKRQAALRKEVEGLRAELTSYSEDDPVEIEKRRERTLACRKEAEKWTDQILSMECWIKAQAGGNREQFAMMQRDWYGAEFDEEEGGLREF
jgi:Mnd1 HTH domain